MRQSRRSTPTFSSLTALRALGGALVAAAVLSAPVQITAAQPAEAPRAPARPPAPAAAAAPTAPPAAYDERRNADQTRDRLRDVINQYSPTLFEVFRHDPSLLLNPDYLAN